VDGLHYASGVSALVLLATAGAAWFLLKGQKLQEGVTTHH
jgi:DHA2 family multidrug resistance protein-like MFS transporter